MKKIRICPRCGSEMTGTFPKCPDCGHSAPVDQWLEKIDLPPSPATPQEIRFIGDKDSPLVVRKRAGQIEIGRPLLLQCSAEGRYADAVQFVLCWSGNTCRISPIEGCKHETLLNQQPLTAPTTLKHGDRLSLRGRKSLRTAMPVTLIYHP
ncbi:MAG: hypothetical protein IJB89_03555 [Akkermansia sp.]|nr:hypothetical protein [Akkermansia sp.]